MSFHLLAILKTISVIQFYEIEYELEEEVLSAMSNFLIIFLNGNCGAKKNLTLVMLVSIFFVDIIRRYIR
jgi:hypothetical protein